MRIESFVLAEAVATDSRGAVTLVGVNQRGALAIALPWHVQVVGFVVLTDYSENGPFTSVHGYTLETRVIDPLGNSAFAHVEVINQVVKAFPDLPLFGSTTTDCSWLAQHYGEYRIRATLTNEAEPAQQAERLFHVVRPTEPAASQPEA